MQVVLKDEGEKDLTPGDLSYASALRLKLYLWRGRPVLTSDNLPIPLFYV